MTLTQPSLSRKAIYLLQALLPGLIAMGGALIWITAGGWTLGMREGWAFNYLIHVPLMLRLGMALLLVSAWGLPVAKWRGWTFSAARFWSPRTVWVGLAFALGLFWFLREQTWHGDARYKVQLLTDVPLPANPYVWKEPLNSLLEYGLTAWLAGWQQPPEVAVALLSVLAGGVYVTAAGGAATWLRCAAHERWLTMVMLLATGSSQLWFGHVENYSWPTALAFATLVALIGQLQGRVSLGVVGLLGGAACSLHPQAAFVLPALVFALRRQGWQRSLLTLGLTGAVFPLLTLLAYRLLEIPPPLVGTGFAGDPQLFWAASQALHPAQVATALHNLWLVAPLWPLWLMAASIVAFAPSLRRDRVFGLLTTAVLSLLVYHFTFQNDLPRARDWDLYAIVGPPLTLWGLYAAWRLMDAIPNGMAEWGRVWAVATCFSLLHTASWVGVNAGLTLLRPTSAERELFVRHRHTDLLDALPHAQVTPAAPICAEAVGCERVVATTFTMPQTGDIRPTLFAHAPVAVTLPVQLPPGRAFLWVSPALDPQAWDWGGDGVAFSVRVRTAAGEATLWTGYLSPSRPSDRNWQEVFIPLDAYAGQKVDVILVTDPGPAGNGAADRAGWGMPWIMRGTYDARPPDVCARLVTDASCPNTGQ